MVYSNCSIACENRYCHSALGGGAAPSPFFLVQVTFAVHFSACVYIYIYEYECVFWHVALPVKTGIVILLWGEALRPPPIPPPASLFKSHLHYTSVHVCIYICVFACSVACENRYCHSALGGRAAPLFLFRLNTYAGTCMSIEHIYMRPQGSRGIYRVTLWTPHGLAIRRE